MYMYNMQFHCTCIYTERTIYVAIVLQTILVRDHCLCECRLLRELEKAASPGESGLSGASCCS